MRVTDIPMTRGTQEEKGGVGKCGGQELSEAPNQCLCLPVNTLQQHSSLHTRAPRSNCASWTLHQERLWPLLCFTLCSEHHPS